MSTTTAVDSPLGLVPGTVVDVATLKELLDQGVDLRLLDVRTPAESESAHITGSYNVPLDTLAEHSAELHRRLDVPVVVICRTGNRAKQAEARLAAAGMSNLHVLDGGIAAWESAGHDLVRGRNTWSLERQVRLVAGAIVLAGIVGSLRWPKLRFVSGGVGAGLTVAALTDTCAMGMALSKLPHNRSASCDIDQVVAALCER